MNYQPLFDVMSQHGLTLLEGEMEEIIRAVNEGQGTPTDTNKYDPALYWVMGNHGDVPPQVTPKQKKLTYTEIRTLYLRHSNLDSLYNALLPYLADEQPEQFTALGSTTMNPPTKPDPSRLEVAAVILPTLLNMEGNRVIFDDVKTSICIADELIKQAKG